MGTLDTGSDLKSPGSTIWHLFHPFHSLWFHQESHNKLEIQFHRFVRGKGLFGLPPHPLGSCAVCRRQVQQVSPAGGICSPPSEFAPFLANAYGKPLWFILQDQGHRVASAVHQVSSPHSLQMLMAIVVYPDTGHRRDTAHREEHRDMKRNEDDRGIGDDDDTWGPHSEITPL